MLYHIIWTTYGTWLPGDERGWLRKGEPAVKPPNPELQRACRESMREEMVLLDDGQRQIIDKTITDHCLQRGWTVLVQAVKTNHVHVVVEADRDGEDVRDQFKAWCSRRLSDAAGLTKRQTKKGGRRRWFTEGGYVRQIETEEYLLVVIAYVDGQKELAPSPTP